MAAAARGAMCEGEGGGGDVESKFPALSSALPTEAPTSIFNAKLGKGPDADAELLVSGSWSSTILGTISLQKDPGGSFASTAAQPLLFTQEPDMALSFLLYKRVFVEARVSQTVSEAKYAAGYRGQEGEFIKEVRVGNDGINFPTLPFLSFGEGSYRSFGASALVGNDTFAGKAMVRYDQASRVTKRFVGSTEVTESVIAASSFITGKYFMTRAAPNASVAVYVESSSGGISGSDGKKYRRLDASEYSYSAATGLVSLSVAASTRVLAYYPGSGASDSVALSGVGACDWLYDPPSSDHETATIDPKLQALCRYPTTASSSTGEAFVRNTGSGLRDSYFDAEISDSGYVEVTRPGRSAASARAAGAADEYRKPFASPGKSWDMSYIYATDFAADAGKIGAAPVYSREIVVRTFASASKITIDKDFVAGSVEVTRNGVPDYSFSVDQDSGVVTLASPPEASEEIIITYLKESAERKSGIIVGALGGFWDLGSGKTAWTAIGAAWSLPGSSYSSGSDKSPGSVNLTAGEKDAKGPFKNDAAIALRYSRDDSTGISRIEGMESAGDYASTFRQLSTSTAYIDLEVAENDLKSDFPTIVKDFHKDGSTQKALRIVSDGSSSAAFSKVEDEPAYDSYKTFAFYAKLPPDASLTVKLDDGSSTTPSDLSGASVGIVVPADPARKGGWGKYLLRYGDGDSTVYREDDEDSSDRRVTGASSKAPTLKSTGSRLVISVTGLAKGEEAWIDEIVLEDSVGRGAALFQGNASYDDPSLKLGASDSPALSGIKATGFAQGALDSDPYAAGGGSLAGSVYFIGLGLRARTTMADRSAHFSGGHSIELPNRSFPIAVKDDFDYDPSNGAFGRADSAALRLGGVAALTAKQSSDWTPDSTVSDEGVLVQDWSNSLVLGPSWLSLGLAAKNRTLPDESPSAADRGNGYAGAWYKAFKYALPAFEGFSDLREAKSDLSVKNGDAEYLSASLEETTLPGDGGTGTRSDLATARIAFPFPAFSLKLEPYYARKWSEKRDGSSESIVGDAKAAIGDVADAPVLYRGIPFSEFGSSSTKRDFIDQTSPEGTALPSAEFVPETGIKMARESGSMPIDLIAPEALTLSYGRSLTRADDAVTDASQYKASAKIAAVNVFGTMGTHPLGLPFDSDEYMTTIQADLTKPRDGSASSYDLLYHSLATFYAGAQQENKLDAETKITIAALPSSMNWSGSLSLSLSRRIEKHWLLSAYRSLIKPALPDAPSSSGPTEQAAESAAANPAKDAAEGSDAGAAADSSAQTPITSVFLSDLKARAPIMRSTWNLLVGLSGARSDAEAYHPGWSLAEGYEAKLTVPERLTVKANAAFSQSVDAETRVATLGFLLSLNAVVSF